MADWAAGSRAATAWLGTIGRPVAARALPTWAGVAIVAGVIMGGNGLSPREVVSLASTVRAVAILGVTWLLLSSAAVRVGFGAPGAAYLRSLPGARAWETFAIVVAAAAVHLPWAVLWFAGGAPGRAGAAWAGMTAVSLLVVAGGGRLVRHPPPPDWRGPVRALAGVHVRALLRRRASALVVGGGMAALGGAFAALVIGHEAQAPRDAVVIAGACSSIALAAALIAATAAVADSDRQLGWLATAAAVPGGARRLARASVLGMLGVLAGLVATAAAAAVAPLAPRLLAAVAATHAVIGLGLGLGAVEISARAWRDDRIDGGRVVIGMLVLGTIALVSIGFFHAVAVPAFVAVGAGLATGGRAR